MTASKGFSELLQQQAIKPLWGGSEDLWKYREAAAVLSAFDFDSLQPVGTVPATTAKTELLADCTAAEVAGGALVWSLRTPVRQAALRRLLRDGRVAAALAANPRRASSASQELFTLCLTGGTPSTDQLRSPAAGRALLEVMDWVGGLPELAARLPAVESVQRRIAREQLLQPFRDLVGESFAGRRQELTELAEYVGVYDAQSWAATLTRGVEQIFAITQRPPLFINGPGGCGKSTLIGRFILSHAEIEESSRFPFAYLDFDRPGLVAEEPITLLAEVLRQLAIQLPDTSDAYQQLASEWRDRVAGQVAGTEVAGPLSKSRLRLGDRDLFFDQFAAFVNDLKASDQPLLLVLDTFEEIQFRSAAFADEVLDFLNTLQGVVPRLRTVLAGRAEIRSKRFKIRRLAIGNFDEAAATAYLKGQGVAQEEVAKAIFDQVGGSPLVLRLAADVAKLEEIDHRGIDGLSTGWLARFQSQSIESVLYKRILSHVYDRRVQQLAYPGLVMRVITPSVLEHVLAEACGVAVTSHADAQGLVATMRDQLATLLIPKSDEGEALAHRPDMRAILLQDLKTKSDKDTALAETLRRIHTAAVAFYEAGEGPAERAEELYHRLALGVDRELLAARWQPDLGAYLGSSIRELPEPSQIYLAARLEVELPEEVWSRADDEDWLLYATRAATERVDLGKAMEAVVLLGARRQLLDRPQLRPVVDRVAWGVFLQYGRDYEELRKSQPSGARRTRNMDALMSAAVTVQRSLPVDRELPRRLFAEGTSGARVVALVLAAARPYAEYMDLAIDAIDRARTPFEQFHGLGLALQLFDSASQLQRAALEQALDDPKGVPIHDSDPSRTMIRDELLRRLEQEPPRRS